MSKSLSLKILLLLAINRQGLTYRQIQKRTGFHVNTVSRCVSCLYDRSIIEIKQKKSPSLRGKKWINVVKLKPELAVDSITEFFSKIAAKCGVSLDDLFVD